MTDISTPIISGSPIAALGTIVLLVSFVLAAYAATMGMVGAHQRKDALVVSSMNALWGFGALMVLASALIIYAFVSHDFSIRYVAHYSDTTMPLWYKLTSYWGGLDGSMLFWVFVLAVFSCVAVYANRWRHRDIIGYVIAVIMVIQLFFLAVLIYSKNPFATFLTQAPVDGKGLNPLLQNYWMIIHPPALYLGLVSATIPFAFCIGALAAGRLDNAWVYSVRVWVLICWFFLSLGLILGGRWAYEELGWGGYWAWDPVENSALIPWFTATAVLHSIIIQEQRGSMKIWNAFLIIATFFLTIFGTFMTRSGIVQSVHAFGEDNELALLFILFMVVILVFSLGLLLFRVPRLKSQTSFDSFISREFAFLLNNWILLGCAIFVLFATMFSTISENLTGQRVTVGPPFFNKWMTPLGLVLVLLSGVAPLLAWRKTTLERLKTQMLTPFLVSVGTVILIAIVFPKTRVTNAMWSNTIQVPLSLICFGIVMFTLMTCIQEFRKGVRVRRNQTGSGHMTSLIGIMMSRRRRYGGYLVHMGVAVMFIGFAGKAYELEKDFTFTRVGETIEVRQYTLEYTDKLSKTRDDHKTAWTAGITVYENNEKIARLEPARWIYGKLPDQPTTESAISHMGLDDIYLALLGFDEESVNFRLFINPLIQWVWIGFMILSLGTFVCLIPESMLGRLKASPLEPLHEDGSNV